MKKILLVLGLFLLFPHLAEAQSQRNPCFYTAANPGQGNGCIPVSSANPLPVAASVSASISGFTPNLSYATLSAAASSASVALPSGTTIALQNTGSATVSCTLGVGSATATANQIQVPASSTVFVTPGSNTFAACIDQTGSASNTVVLAGGTGLGAGFGGGGGGSGGGGVVTQPTASQLNATVVGTGTFGVQVTSAPTTAVTGTFWPYTLGQQLAAASVPVILPAATITTLTPPAAITGFGTAANQATIITALTTLNTNVTSPIPAGTNTIGTTGQLPYPVGAVPYTNSATATTTGAVATLAGSASVTTYVCGFSVRANATAATTVNIVVSGTISGSLNFTEWVAPAASGLGISEMIFSPCIPASTTNTSIVVTGGAPGTGGVTSTTAWGYKL